MTTLPPLAYPGLPLAPLSSHSSGPGTHIHNAQIIASICGRPSLLPAAALPSATTSKSNTTSSSKQSSTSQTKPTVTIPYPAPSPTHASISSASISNTNTLPKVGDVVLARVVRVRVRQVDVVLLCVNQPAATTTPTSKEILTTNANAAKDDEIKVCADEWPAVVRKEDVRATEKEKVVTSEGFRVGDVIRGAVISLGDQANYYLTTARNELGVLMARSEGGGNLMQPISWKEFRDPVTGEVEGRKVAKPF